MPARVTLPAEAFDFSRSEIRSLRTFEREKEFDGLLVNADEPVPATGRSANIEGPRILRGSTDCLMLHVEEIYGVQNTRRQLALAGTYVGLHEELRRRRFVVGVTHGVMARLAVRAAGFEQLRIKDASIDLKYYNRLRDVYYGLSWQPWPTPRLAMIYMGVPDFIETFASAILLQRREGDRLKL